MAFDHRARHPSSEATARHHAATPGKRTLTELLPARRGAGFAPHGAWRMDAEPTARPRAPDATAGARPALQTLFGRPPASTAGQLPHADHIQRAFGRHDISTIQAHTGAEASASSRAIGAGAYAIGDHVVLGDRADLHTAAHEAAHVVQQRGGVQLHDGIGEAGDRYEQHADAVATLVVQGQSAERLLDEHAPRDPGAPQRATTPQIQRFPIGDSGIDTDDPHQIALQILTLGTDQLRTMVRALKRDPRTARQPNAEAALARIQATLAERFVGVPGGVDPVSALAGHEDLLHHALSYLSDDQLGAILHTGNHAWRDRGADLLVPRFLDALNAGQLEEAARVRRLAQLPLAMIAEPLTCCFAGALANGDLDHAGAILRIAPIPVEAIVDREHNTPLHLAILYGHEPLTAVLLAAGHPTDLVNQHGLTPRAMLEPEAEELDPGQHALLEPAAAAEPSPRLTGRRASPRAPHPPRSQRSRKREKEREKEPEKASERAPGDGHDAPQGSTSDDASRRGPVALDLAQLRAALETDYVYQDDWMVTVGSHAIPRPVADLLAATREYNHLVRIAAPTPMLLVTLQTVARCCQFCCGHDDLGALHYMVDAQHTMAAKVLVYHWMTQRIPELIGELGWAARITLPHLGPPSTLRFPERHHSVDPASAPAPGSAGWKNVPDELRRDPDLAKLASHKDHAPDAKSTQEALSGLAAKHQDARFKKITPAPRRDTEPKDVEFYDTRGMPWDQKGPCSHSGEDDVQPIASSVAKQLKERFPERGRTQAKEAQPLVGVILDCTYLTERDYRRLWALLIAQLDAEALQRIVEVNVDFSSLAGKRDDDGPALSPALSKLLDRATTTSHGAGPCGPIFTIPQSSLANHVTNLDVVRSDPDGVGGFCLFKNHGGHVPQRPDSYFVEYAVAGTIAEGESGSRVKLVHDKRGDGRLYITATHYTPFSLRGRDAALRNPFFEIVGARADKAL